MSWVDEAERLGRLVDAGEITKAEAVEQLLSTGISLSPDGAADLIGRWRTIRADLAASRREMAPDRKWAQRS